jgi:hypothetical protein
MDLFKAIFETSESDSSSESENEETAVEKTPVTVASSASLQPAPGSSNFTSVEDKTAVISSAVTAGNEENETKRECARAPATTNQTTGYICCVFRSRLIDNGETSSDRIVE